MGPRVRDWGPVEGAGLTWEVLGAQHPFPCLGSGGPPSESCQDWGSSRVTSDWDLFHGTQEPGLRTQPGTGTDFASLGCAVWLGLAQSWVSSTPHHIQAIPSLMFQTTHM